MMQKKTVLITGCSANGIGAAMAQAFHDQGFYVFATLRNTAKAGSLSELHDVEILELDVTSKESVKQCAQAVQKRTGGALDVLVNNAGLDFVIPLLDVDIDEAKKLYDANVWSILSTTQAFAPMLIEAKGAICNIASVAAIMPLAWSGESHSESTQHLPLLVFRLLLPTDWPAQPIEPNTRQVYTVAPKPPRNKYPRRCV